jgi:FkbM family methyltransferase
MFGSHVAAAIMRDGDTIYAIDIEDQAVRPTPQPYKPPVAEEIDRVSRFLDPNAEVLIVGAHIGTVAIPVSRLCRELWAIEANPHTFELLQFNLKLNDAKNIHALNVVAGERKEEIDFILNRANSGGSKRMPKIRAPIYFYDHPAVIRLKTQALDDILPRIAFSVVFMDIEGSEYSALKGMQRILSEAKALFVEFLPHHLRDVSGVAPEEFVGLIEPHFSALFVPSKNRRVGRPEFKSVLREMYDKNEGDPGLVFTR